MNISFAVGFSRRSSCINAYIMIARVQRGLNACKLVNVRVRFTKFFYTSFCSQTSVLTGFKKQTISVANLLYECSKEESILIEAYKSATFFGSRQSLAQVRASLT